MSTTPKTSCRVQLPAELETLADKASSRLNVSKPRLLGEVIGAGLAPYLKTRLAPLGLTIPDLFDPAPELAPGRTAKTLLERTTKKGGSK